VQHLGRADAVEDVAADALAPAHADVSGQRLARRGRHAQLVLMDERGVGEQLSEQRRHAAEHGRAVAGERAQHRLRRRALGEQHGGGADRERKRQRVAEAVGEEQLGGREHDVIGGDAEDRARV
jgi:hypothetical protein